VLRADVVELDLTLVVAGAGTETFDGVVRRRVGGRRGIEGFVYDPIGAGAQDFE
jgi:hypothetical protein